MTWYITLRPRRWREISDFAEISLDTGYNVPNRSRRPWMYGWFMKLCSTG